METVLRWLADQDLRNGRPRNCQVRVQIGGYRVRVVLEVTA
jgi:hypothetical protein